MKRIFLGLLLLQSLFATFSYAESKPRVVLLPVVVSENDDELKDSYGAAIQEGLQSRFEVISGNSVEKEIKKEADKVDCSAE